MELSPPILEMNYTQENMNEFWVTIITSPQRLAFQGSHYYANLLLALHRVLRDTGSDSPTCKYQYCVIDSLQLLSKNSQTNWSLARHCLYPIFDTCISKNPTMFMFRGRTMIIVHSKQWW